MLDILIGSRTRLEIIRRLFTAEHSVLRLRDMAAQSGLSVPSLSKELHKLSAIGIITIGRNGNAATCRANEAHPFFTPLCDLVRREYGVTDTILAALSGDDIIGVYVIGDGLECPAEPLELCAQTELPYRKVNKRLIPASDAIGREIRLRVLNSKEFATTRGRSKFHILKDFEGKKSDR